MMEMQKVLEQRRSIRKYQDKPIKKEVVEELLHAALLAPTVKNSQTGRYYAVMDKDKLEQVKKEGLAPFNAENTKDAPVLIVTTFVKDRSGYERNGEPSNELGNGWGCYDLGLQNENLLLKATDLGLSTLVMGIRDADRLREMLSISEEEIIVSVIAVGYGDATPTMPKRKEISEFVTFY